MYYYRWGHAVAQLAEAVRYKAEKAVSSIPDGVIRIFY